MICVIHGILVFKMWSGGFSKYSSGIHGGPLVESLLYSNAHV